MTLCNYWKVIPLIDWPSRRILRISAVQAECLYMEVCIGKNIKMSVTSTYIECATGE